MSLLSSEAKAEGTLAAQEPLEIQGEFQGELRSRTQLSVASGGRVRGEIEAPRVVVQGKVVGNVKAARQLEIHAEGHFLGRLLVQPDVLILSPKADFAERPEDK